MSFTLTACKCLHGDFFCQYTITKFCLFGDGAKGQLHCTTEELRELRDQINDVLNRASIDTNEQPLLPLEAVEQ